MVSPRFFFSIKLFETLASYEVVNPTSFKFPFVSKRPIVLGITDLLKFNYEDLEQTVAVGQGSFGTVFKA